MGIYAVTPGEEKWESNEPIFDSIKINAENGDEFIDYKKEFVNGKPSRIFILGKKLKEEMIQSRSAMGSQVATISENKNRKSIVPVPLIQAEGKAFKDKLAIDIVSQNPSDKLYYYIEKNNESKSAKIWDAYKGQIIIDSNTEILAKSQNENGNSAIVSAKFYKKPTNYTIEIKSKYNPQYTAGGDEGIIDGINGSENWRKGEWQGYQSQDFEAVIDLQTEKNVSNFSATFLQDSGSWILMPTKVDYYVSNDKVNFTLVGSVTNSISPKSEINKIENFNYQSPQELKAKYVKVKAYNFGKLPDWHQGAGGDAFIFIDEITIK
jgi:hypothetical protein